MWELLSQGAALLTITAFLYLLLGALVGNVAALLPGLGSFQAIAIFLPISVYMDVVPALAFAVGVYAGGQYGGAIPAILFGTPGTAEAAATTLDGYPMRKKGEAGKALKVALFAGVTADIFAATTLLFGVGLLAPLALRIGPPEYFALVLAALTLIAVVSEGSALKGAAAAAIGLLLSLIGADPTTGIPRMTFGIYQLDAGIEVVPAILGLFAVSELFNQLLASKGTGRQSTVEIPDSRFRFADYRQCLGAIGVGTGVGLFIGLLPGLGATVAAFVAYAVGKKVLRNTESFGSVDPRGVALTEGANDATVGPTLVPLITLGIPGSPTAALFLAVFMLQGIEVGPLVMQTDAPAIYAVFILFLIMPFVNLFGGYFIRSAAPLVLKTPAAYLYPGLLVVTLVGAYSARSSIFDVVVAVSLGFAGFGLRSAGIPLAPLLIAFLLGGPAESAFRKSMIIFHGDWSQFLGRPITLAFLLVALASVMLSVIPPLRALLKHKDEAPRAGDADRDRV